MDTNACSFTNTAKCVLIMRALDFDTSGQKHSVPLGGNASVKKPPTYARDSLLQSLERSYKHQLNPTTATAFSRGCLVGKKPIRTT